MATADALELWCRLFCTVSILCLTYSGGMTKSLLPVNSTALQTSCTEECVCQRGVLAARTHGLDRQELPYRTQENSLRMAPSRNCPPS